MVGFIVRPRNVQRPVRVGVFDTVAEARGAVDALLAEGFTRDDVSVLCSDEAKEREFREYEHDAPAGRLTPGAARAGAVIGGVVGGLVGLVAAGDGVAVVVLGPFSVGAGAAFGTFVGAMTSRGVEREVANYYDQALAAGLILVAAEIDDDVRERVERAEAVFRRVGARPLPLPLG